MSLPRRLGIREKKKTAFGNLHSTVQYVATRVPYRYRYLIYLKKLGKKGRTKREGEEARKKGNRGPVYMAEVTVANCRAASTRD